MPRTWESFDLSLDYKRDGQKDSLPAIRVNSESRVIPVKVGRKRITWLGGTSPGSLAVELVLNSQFDLRVNAEVRATDGISVAKGSALLERGRDTTILLTQPGVVAIGPEMGYSIHLLQVPTDLPIEFAMEEKETSWKSPNKAAASFDLVNIADLQKLNITDKNVKTIKVNVTTLAKRMEIKFNDDADWITCSVDSNNATEYRCPVRHESLVDGRINRFALSGTSDNDRELSQKAPISFNYDSRFKLVGGMRLTQSEGNLTVVTALDKRPDPLGVGLRLQPMNVDPTSLAMTPLGTSINLGRPSSPCANNECKFVINNATDIAKIVNALGDDPKRRIALLVSVIVGEKDAAGDVGNFLADPIGQVAFDAYNSNARLVTKLEKPAVKTALQTFIDNASSNATDAQLITGVKSTLQLPTDTTDAENKAIQFIVDTIRSKPRNRDRVWSIVRFIDRRLSHTSVFRSSCQLSVGHPSVFYVTRRGAAIVLFPRWR